MGLTPGYDATHENLSSVPKGQIAGYVTGTPNIVWTDADWESHPGAIRIDQSPTNDTLDETADALDFENGAATLADIGAWAKAALANFHTVKRPGQRMPVIYASQNNLTPVANALVAAGLGNAGIGLWVANWNLSSLQASAIINDANGPFPIRGIQFWSGAAYDLDIWETAWLTNVSTAASPTIRGRIIDTELNTYLATTTNRKTWTV